METSFTNPLDEPKPLPLEQLDKLFGAFIDQVKASRPGDRSPRDRYFAMVISYLECARGLFFTYVLHN